MRLTFRKTTRIPAIPLWLILTVTGGLAVFCGGLILYHLLEPNTPLCALKILAGIPCPICGSLRLLQALLRGDIGAAFLLNPLVFCLGVVSLALAVLRLGFGRVINITGTIRDGLLGIGLGLLLVAANWTYLIIDGR